jgi:hypothetical protein
LKFTSPAPRPYALDALSTIDWLTTKMVGVVCSNDCLAIFNKIESKGKKFNQKTTDLLKEQSGREMGFTYEKYFKNKDCCRFTASRVDSIGIRIHRLYLLRRIEDHSAPVLKSSAHG